MVEAPTGGLGHLGESFPFHSDSGAECSLIGGSVALRFFGRGAADMVVMRGTCIERASQILSIVFMCLHL